MPAGSLACTSLCTHESRRRRQRCFRRLTFTIVSFGPLFHRNDQDAPLSRRLRDCAVKNVISEWCFHRILLPRPRRRESRRATTIVSFSRRKKNYVAAAVTVATVTTAVHGHSWIYRRRGPSMEIAYESKYLCPGYMHISYPTDFSSKSRVRVLEYLARSRKSVGIVAIWRTVIIVMFNNWFNIFNSDL